MPATRCVSPVIGLTDDEPKYEKSENAATSTAIMSCALFIVVHP